MGERLQWIPNEAFGITDEQAQTLDYGNPDALLGLLRKKSEWEHFTPEFVGTKTQSLDLQRTLREISLAQRAFTEARISQPEGEVRIDTPYPLSLVFNGDNHFGSIFTDHKVFMARMKTIKETPNMGVIFMSNLIDNGIPGRYPDVMLVNAIPPDKQVVAVRKVIEELNEAGKVLAAVTSPCHEGWTFKVAGQDVNAMIYGFEGRKFPVLENGGRLTIRTPKAKYIVGLYHMCGPFESNFNPTHALKQMNRLRQNMECDIVAGGHKHYAEAAMCYEGIGKRRKPVAYVRTGTDKGVGKIHDLWATGRYGTTGEPTGQTVMIWPDKKRMEAHLEFETGVLAQESHLLRAMAELNKQG